MDETREAGLQQTQEQPANEIQAVEQVEPSESLIDSFFGEGLSEGEQPEKAEQSQAETKQEEKAYTPEEIEELGLEKLDPNRLPPEVVPFYKSMQADYTRKTQALAEERKVIERVLDKALSHPELAREFMSDPELVGLAQKHPELAQKLQAVSQKARIQEDPLDVIAQTAKEEFKKRYGVEFDPFDEDHVSKYQALVAQKTLEFQQRVAEEQRVVAQIQQLVASEPHFQEIDAYAYNKLYNELPKAKADEILGNPEKLIEFWKQCRDEWYKQKVQTTQQQPQKTSQQLPPVESGGNQQVQAEPSGEELLQWFFKGD